MTHDMYHLQDFSRPLTEFSRSESQRKLRKQTSSSTGDDYSTIDWMKEYVKDNELKESFNPTSINSYIQNLEPWFLLTIIGIGIGFLASWIDIITAFLSDIKRGICVSDWYLSKDICCKGLERTGEHCLNYQPWGKHLGLPLDFIIYTISAV